MENLIKRGLYVHVPFCQNKCKYCSFYSITKGEIPEYSYLDSLLLNLDNFNLRNNIKFSSIYFGGGTPSLMSPDFFSKFFEKLAIDSQIEPNSEITVELNPEHVTKDYLKELKLIGINRVSIGIQSLNPLVLKYLDRIHSREKALEAVELALNYFNNVSCDFIIGIKNAKNEIDNIMNFQYLKQINHLSLYILEGDRNLSFMEDEDLVANKYLKVSEMLEENGFNHYEISNFSRDGFEAKHNLLYWEGEEYIGIGPSAHSLILSSGKPTRVAEKSNLIEFLSGKFKKEINIYENEEFARELLMLALRLKKGVNIKDFQGLYNFEIKEICNNIIKKFGTLIKIDENTISLTKKGFLLSNEIFETII